MDRMMYELINTQLEDGYLGTYTLPIGQVGMSGRISTIYMACLPIILQRATNLLRTFVFVPECQATGFVVPHCAFDWTGQTLSVNALDLNALPFPKGATHLGLTLGVLDFDFETLNHRLHLSPTAYLEKNSTVAGFTLQPDVVVPQQHSGFVVLGLQFVEILDGEVYVLKAMKAFGALLLVLTDFVRILEDMEIKIYKIH